MTPSDTELREWYEAHESIYEWINAADNILVHGSIIVHYCEGEPIGCDICPRVRLPKKSC